MTTRRSLLTRAVPGSLLAALASLLPMGCGGPLTAPPSVVPPEASPVASDAETVREATARFTKPTIETAPAAPASTATRIETVPAASMPKGPTPVALTPAPQATAPPPALPAAPKLSGSQLLSRSFSSPALGREMPYFVYLPVGYAESATRYPTLYMLHGYGGSNTEWLAVGFPEEADKEMNAGEIPQMIIVFPQGDQAYWVNHATDGELWGDYTAQDVVAHIDATYRTIADAPHRAAGGLSMGAHGAMQLALNYPGTFSVVGMHSPTLRAFADRFDYFGDEAFFDAHDPSHLVQQYPDRAQELKIFVDVGEQDQDWYEKTVAFHDLLTSEQIPHEFHTWPGVHDGSYWGPHSRDYLHFYAANLAPGM